MEGEEEYKQLAAELKDQGNEAFQAGDIEGAIRCFTQSIDLDPDNHVVYSNRSAAFMKADSKSKALKDAEKCVELAPQWAKGYNRLGVAQQSLKRFDAAITTFKKGIELEYNNQALWAALKSCEEAYRQDKEQRFRQADIERKAEEERLKRKNEIREEILREKQEAMLDDFLSDLQATPAPAAPEPEPLPSAEDDDLLASFFTEVTAKAEEQSKTKAQTATTALKEGGGDGEGGEGEKEAVLTEKYAQQDLGNGRDQCARLLSKHWEWRNLNPFFVLQLDIDANEEDIKYRYKKLSLRVHPDRLRDIENARDAFEQVKEAYTKLMDPDQRRTLSMHIENVTQEVTKDRKKLLSKGAKESDLLSFEEERERRIMKHFAELEMMRRKSDQNRRAYSAREKMQESKEEEDWGKKAEFEKGWSEENRREKRVGNWRDFQDVPEAKKARAANFKEELREETKFGTVKLETWKKAWK